MRARTELSRSCGGLSPRALGRREVARSSGGLTPRGGPPSTMGAHLWWVGRDRTRHCWTVVCCHPPQLHKSRNDGGDIAGPWQAGAFDPGQRSRNQHAHQIYLLRWSVSVRFADNYRGGRRGTTPAPTRNGGGARRAGSSVYQLRLQPGDERFEADGERGVRRIGLRSSPTADGSREQWVVGAKAA